MSSCMIVEDDLTSQTIVGAIIQRLGMATHCHPTAEQAWQHLVDMPPPDLLIVDYNLPGATGLALTRRVRSLSWCAGSPIIMISGVIKASQIHSVLRDGVDRFIPKPVDAKDLIGQIRSLNPALVPDDFALPAEQTPSAASDALPDQLEVQDVTNS